ncbi:MAG TPA: hypothetical protein VFZ81_12450 [Burkholderiales bacterium]
MPLRQPSSIDGGSKKSGLAINLAKVAHGGYCLVVQSIVHTISCPNLRLKSDRLLAVLSNSDDAGRQGQRSEREQYRQWREQAETARHYRVLHNLAGQVYLRVLRLTAFAPLPERDVGIAMRRDL